MIDSILHFTARVTCRHPWTVLALSAALAVLCAAYASLRLELNANTDDLIASDQPFMDNYRAFLEEFGDLEYLFIVVAGGEPGQREQSLHHFARLLQGNDQVPSMHFVIPPAEQMRIATRAMPLEELRELAMTSHSFGAIDAGPAAALEHADDLLQQLMASSDRKEQEALGASAVFLLQTLADEQLMHWPQAEYLTSDSGAFHFLQIEPVRDYGTLDVIREQLTVVRSAIEQVRPEFSELEFGLTGKPVLQADEMHTTDRDMTRAAILAIVLVTALFMLVIGGIRHPALAVVALLCGIAWTFGLTTLVLGQLNLLSIVFTLVLVGVGIDFGIHLVSRYKEQRSGAMDGEQDIEAAIHTALTTTGRGNITGAITSSTAFFMAMFTQFQGLRELGFIAGSGLILCLIAMLLVLPSLIVVFDRRREKRGGSLPALPQRTSLQRGAWQALMTHPRLFLLAVAIATLGLLLVLPKLRYEQDLLALQAEHLPSVQWEKRIIQDSAETWFGAVVVDSQEQVLDVIARAEAQEEIARAGSIFDIIQPPSEQRDVLRASLHEFDPLSFDSTEEESWGSEQLQPVIDRLGVMIAGARMRSEQDATILVQVRDDLRTLTRELEDPDTRDAAKQAAAARLDETAAIVRTMLAGDSLPLREALPAAVRDRYLSPQGRYLVMLFPAENVWAFEPMGRFVAAMRRVHPDATGVPITQHESLIEMRRAFLTAAGLAFLAVFILIWLDLRRFDDALLAMVPLVLGMIWLAQAMALTGLTFNPANFFAIPILIGIGVDSGIHLIHRYREQRDDASVTMLRFGSTRRAVFMTAMTSLIGFGCLALASHKGLQSLGLVMAVGALALLIASLFVLPALLAVLQRR